MNELTNEIIKKRREYYTEYYKKNRDRLLQYQHQYNQSHSIIKSSKDKVCRQYGGKLAVTRMNIKKRLNQLALRVANFKKELELQRQITNTGLQAKDNGGIFLPL